MPLKEKNQHRRTQDETTLHLYPVPWSFLPAYPLPATFNNPYAHQHLLEHFIPHLNYPGKAHLGDDKPASLHFRCSGLHKRCVKRIQKLSPKAP